MPCSSPTAIERRQHVGGELAGFLQHGGGDVAVEIAVMAGLDGGLQAGAMVERKQHVGDRRAVGHGGHSLGGHRLAPYSHETGEVSTSSGTGRTGAARGAEQAGAARTIYKGWAWRRPNGLRYFAAPGG